MDKKQVHIDNQPARKLTGSAKLLITTTVVAVLLASVMGLSRIAKNHIKLGKARRDVSYFMQFESLSEARPALAAKAGFSLGDLNLDPSLGSRLLIAVLKDPHLNEEEKYNAIKRLLQEGANPNYADKNNYPVIAYANVDCLKLLLEKGANPNAPSAMRRTLLASGAPSRVEMLLQAGADPNIADETGKTPIFYQFEPESLKRLLEYGADPTVICKDEHTALEQYQAWNHQPKESLTKMCELLEQAEKEWQDRK